MIKINIDKLLFTKKFLELKYKIKSKKVIKLVNEKYKTWKLDFLDVDKNNNIDKIEKFVKEKKKLFDSIVVLWIWWSTLWTRAIIQAIKWKYYNELSKEKRQGNPRLYIIDNIDPTEIQDIINIIDLEKTLFIVISKSGWTIETLSQFTFFKKLLKSKNIDIKNHFTVITWEDSNFKKNSLKYWYEVFDIPKWIWGRFSAFTDVWLLPLAFAWINIREIIKWVTESKSKFLSENIFENNALLTSIIQYHTYYELSKNITVFFPYAWNLFFIGEWYKQMIWESLWKWWVWVTTTTAIWVTDQHSQLQLYYDWPNDKLIIFLEVEDFWIDYNICCNENFTFSHLLKTEKYATEESISSYNKLNYTIKIKNLKEKAIWELILMFEMQTAILWEFYGFNAFDQPWVEVWKKITREKLIQSIWRIEMLENNN